jgi:hypothetical protein
MCHTPGLMTAASLTQNARLLVALHGQLTLKHGELLRSRSSALPGDRVFPYLASVYRCATRRTCGSGVTCDRVSHTGCAIGKPAAKPELDPSAILQTAFAF